MANKLLLVVGLLFALGVACTSAQLGETIDEHANGELFDLFFKQIRQAPADTILVPTTTDTNATDTNTTTPSIAPSAAPSSFPTPAVSPPPAFQLSVTGLPGVTITFDQLPGAIDFDQFDGSQITVLLGESNVPSNAVDVSQFASLAST